MLANQRTRKTLRKKNSYLFHNLTVKIQNEEDQQLKEKLELLNERLRDADIAQRKFALQEIKKEVAGATSSMTSVPKPLKFLSGLYTALRDYYLSLPQSDFKVNQNIQEFNGLLTKL